MPEPSAPAGASLGFEFPPHWESSAFSTVCIACVKPTQFVIECCGLRLVDMLLLVDFEY